MEYTINYTISMPYTARIEADSPADALKQILDNRENNVWPFENMEESFVSSAEILDEDAAQIGYVEDYLAQPHQMIEKLIKKI